MSIRKKYKISILLLMVALTLFGCGSNGSDENYNDNNSYTQTENNTVEQTVSETDVPLDTTDDSDEIETKSSYKTEFEFVGTETFPAVLKSNGDLYIWPNTKNNHSGCSLSVKEIVESEEEIAPILILSNVKKYVNDLQISYAITEDSSLYTWGEDPDHRYDPVKILDNVKEAGYCYAITNDGQLYVWGENKTQEQIQKTPQKVLDNIVSFQQDHIYENDTYVCYALSENGDLYAWGNIYGCVGAKEHDPYTPGIVMENVRDFMIGSMNPYMALTNDDQLFIWGTITVKENNGNFEISAGGSFEELQYNPIKIMDNISSLSENDMNVRFSRFGYNSNCFLSYDNIAYKLERDIDNGKFRIKHIADNVGKIVNDDCYYTTDGTLVMHHSKYKGCRLSSIYNNDCAVLIDEENCMILSTDHKKREGYIIPGKNIISKVVSASAYYAITGNNKLYFWQTDNGIYVNTVDGGYYQKVIIGPKEIKIP